MNRPTPFRHAAIAAALASLALAFGAGAQAAPNNDSSAKRATQDAGYALVQLQGEPLATYSRTRPPKGKKIDFSSSTVKSYRAQLNALRNDYKAWLRQNVPQAKVTGEFDISLNAVAVQLNGATLAQIAATAMVRRAQLQGLYYPLQAGVTDPDLALINAEQAWAAGGGHAEAGRGIKVAVIDSGIDQRHPCFSDADSALYPARTQLGDRRFTNNKVIAAKVFNNKLNQSGFSAKAVGDHGTHVAGTVGCNYRTPATVSGADIPYDMSGVAPAALLGNYNVFPGTVESARSEDILNAMEAAYADGFDVANMSLGGGASGIQDLLTIAVDNLDRANMVVAVSAGNDGPGPRTVGSPGSAARALTSGASTVPHFVGAPVTAGGQTYGAASGDFAVVAADLTATLNAPAGPAPSGLSLACAALPAGSLAGQIALVSRGTCAFSVKIRNAQAAGAAAVLVANNVAGDPIAMGTDGTPNQPTIPAYMVSREDGQALKGASGTPATIDSDLSYFATASANIMAGFSSRGPTDVDFRVKPDVVAPGVNVLSALPAEYCDGALACFGFKQGTSMSSPHLAGSAAVLRKQHPGWSAAEVRSAAVNTATRGVLKDFATGTEIVTDANIVGAGLENLEAAVAAVVALDPVSLSFGALPAGSGQTRTLVVSLSNISGAPQTYQLSTAGGGGGVGFSVSPSSLTVAAGESKTALVTMTAAHGVAAGPRQGTLEIGVSGGNVAHAVLYTLVK